MTPHPGGSADWPDPREYVIALYRWAVRTGQWTTMRVLHLEDEERDRALAWEP